MMHFLCLLLHTFTLLPTAHQNRSTIAPTHDAAQFSAHQSTHETADSTTNHAAQFSAHPTTHETADSTTNHATDRCALSSTTFYYFFFLLPHLSLTSPRHSHLSLFLTDSFYVRRVQCKTIIIAFIMISYPFIFVISLPPY